MKETIALYKDITREINSEVKEGVLFPDDSIQILRAEKPVFQDYCPIKDWYYDEFLIKEELYTPLEEMYMPEEFSDAEWKQMKEEQEELRAQYEKDQPKLVSMKIKDVLTEMKQMMKLF